ncbi:hypothetical protein LTR91_025880 [Friedmanniomyces endolithicus]|uniref:Carboxylic ester hydrolase n=1 Tax=Friedmanniomyces endolithicus TaxID=329885 RepID=A0AAN6H469_9PEZI|nr:hypothetical protein LTR94_005592 [Friedmanniomyces endolithicus]KAK0804593.1 hypothetical protein LTR59_004339 [Friedmanniomyces endolithicus]KAK0816885.1 hypothetical protein LTR38_001915 [Friedmanniomyces endolithicus]KAK0864332.1 hypothetical protein LTS02_006018 [Friedmanniomyces endolithicus]KAK0881813.1 hypothetical protein LTR87_004402 [Friedmanniomyces endolithicus]
MLLKPTYLATAVLGLLPAVNARLRTCVPRDLPAIEVFGLQVVDITAKEHRGYEDWRPSPMTGISVPKRPIDFCNVTITYTHPGQGDRVNVYVWLPLEDWNGRFLGQGGGGWTAGWEMSLAPSVAAGYAVAITDAGHELSSSLPDMNKTSSWTLTSPGNINWVLLQNFASRALDDLPKVARQVVQGFYGEAAKFSYWSGCSTGGRQGLMSAQRYPKNYDGIVATAPAINWATFVVAELWAHIVMRKVGYYPPNCEFEAIRQAAIKACDELDRVKDGVVAAPGLCTFDAKSIVGQTFDCDGNAHKISAKAGEITNAIWEGPVRNGKRAWYGLPHEAPLTGLALTECNASNENCEGKPFLASVSWIRDVVMSGQDIDLSALNEDEYWNILHRSVSDFASIISTDDPDLSDFKTAGGKMITWHGLADQLIPVNGTSDYYEKVLALDPDAKSYYRYFEAPGVTHCAGGPGAAPNAVLDTLVKWVEHGIAPETLDAATVPVDKAEAARHRPLCLYPLVAAYVGGDLAESGSFECAESFDVVKRHTEL